jgi:hypothetical protein
LQEALRLVGVAAGCSRNVAPTMEPQKRQDGVAEGRQALRRLAGVDLTAIFTQGFVPLIVEAVLSGPVTTPELLQLLGACHRPRQAGDAMGRLGFNRPAAGIDATAGAARDLSGVRPTQIARQSG